jgi:hypothetical protein
VDHPIGLRRIKQSLTGAGYQQISLEHAEGISFQRHLVRCTIDSMFVGSFQSKINPKQAAGSGYQNAHDQFSGMAFFQKKVFNC